jgi:hypothetical protein
MHRADVFRKFGPLASEAIFLLSLQEINKLRQLAGLPQYTEEQGLNALEAILDTLAPYPWMQTPGP